MGRVIDSMRGGLYRSWWYGGNGGSVCVYGGGSGGSDGNGDIGQR